MHKFKLEQTLPEIHSLTSGTESQTDGKSIGFFVVKPDCELFSQQIDDIAIRLNKYIKPIS